jgi:tetratricopeptide (TPR) repeat protein
MNDRLETRGKPAAAPLSRRRLWLFRVGALVLFPLLVLGAFEAGLRIAGYGYPTSFFVRTRIDGEGYYVPNERFGLRFFPAAVARTPAPFRMAVKKGTNTFRIFVFGESAAQGDPDPSFGFGRYLQVLLREAYPGADFEVVCVAMTAINSHAILPIARECAQREGDLWLVYMGNNEMIGPFGASTVFGPQAASLPLIRTRLAIQSTKIGQFIDACLERVGKRSAPDAWGGLKMFKEHQLRLGEGKRGRAYDNFQRNLEDILRVGRQAHVPIVVSTVASNLKDCAPFGSLHKVNLAETEKGEWEKIYQDGAALQAAGNVPAALARYSTAAERDAEFAELQFRLGQCHLASTNLDKARVHFELARDYDTLAFRADGRINQIIAKAAKQYADRGVYVFDAQQALDAVSSAGISGQEVFYEHVHMNFDGNYSLARGFADRIAGLLPERVAARRKGDWATAELCERRLAVSPWDRFRVWQLNYSRVSEPPFTQQLNDVPRAKMYMARLEKLESEMNSAAREEALKTYGEAVAVTPTDTYLRGNFSQFLDSIGELARATEEQQRVHEMLPMFPGPLHKIGLLLMRQGRTTEAADYFSRTLALRNDYVPALNELGLIRANRQQPLEAMTCFTNSIRLNPGYVEAYLNLGFVEQGQGNLEKALPWYREAAKRQPDGPAAHFCRAIELAVAQQRPEALKFFGAAVAMDPKFWQARYLLGVELATAERVEEARVQFAEVVRRRPDFAKGHLNLGVALAKQGKLEEALNEFRTTLQLNPTNKLALQHAEKIEALKSRSRQ